MDSKADPRVGPEEEAARQRAGLNRADHQAVDSTGSQGTFDDAGSGDQSANIPVDSIHSDMPGFVDAGDPLDGDRGRNTSIEG
jgi:hypothetical protein